MLKQWTNSTVTGVVMTHHIHQSRDRDFVNFKDLLIMNDEKEKWPLTKCYTIDAGRTSLADGKMLTCRMRRCSSSWPISGNFVLMTATSAANTGVKVGEAICDFIMLRQKRPLPRFRFCNQCT